MPDTDEPTQFPDSTWPPGPAFAVVGEACHRGLSAPVLVPGDMVDVVFGAPCPGGGPVALGSPDPCAGTFVFRTSFPKARAIRRAARKGFVYVVLVDSARVSVAEVCRRARLTGRSNCVSVWYCPRSFWARVRADHLTLAESPKPWFAPAGLDRRGVSSRGVGKKG